MSKSRWHLLSPLVAALATLFVATTAAASVETLLKRPAVRMVTVSPDGRHLAMIRSDEQKDTVIIVRRADMSVATGVNAPAGDRFHRATWASTDRLLVEPAKDRGPLTEPLPTGALIALGVDGSRKSLLSATDAPSRLDTVVVNILPDDPVHVLATDQGKCAPPVCTEGEPTIARLVKLNIDTGEQTIVAEAPVFDARFLSRPTMDVTFVTGRTETGRIQIHQLAGSQWTLLSEFNPASQPGVVPVAITSKGHALALANRVDTIGLYDWDLTSDETTESFRDKNADIDKLIFGFGGQRLLAVRTDPGFPSWHYLTDEHPFTAAHRALRAAFPASDVDVTSFTEGDTEAVVRVYSDRNAGDFYIVNLKTRDNQLLVKSQPWLSPEQLPATEPLQVSSRDGFTLRGLVTSPAGEGPHPTVMLIHDEPYSSRATWRFNPQVQVLAERGFAVLQINYRGSGGFGRAYATAVAVNNRVVQRDITDAAKWAIEQGITDENNLCAYGRGYGAFAAVKALTESRVLFSCAVAINGFFDLSAPYVMPVSPVLRPMSYLAVTSELDLTDASRAPANRVDRIEGAVLVVGQSEQSSQLSAALDAAGKSYTAQGAAQTPADVETILDFIGAQFGAGVSAQPSEPATFGATLSAQQAREFQKIVAKMRSDLDALSKKRALSDAALNREVRRTIERYDDEVRRLVDDQQWQLYPAFKKGLSERLAAELNTVRVR